MSADTSELRDFAKDLGNASAAIAPKVQAVIFKGAKNIKATMRKDLEASPHFKGAAKAVDFDITADNAGLTAEIGPKVGPGESGGHAGIAYGTGVFGGSRGGGSVRDPQAALEEELPALERYLGEAVEGSL